MNKEIEELHQINAYCESDSEGQTVCEHIIGRSNSVFFKFRHRLEQIDFMHQYR